MAATLKMIDSLSLESDAERSEDEGMESSVYTGNTTEAETDLDETEDEGSDPEYDHDEDESRGRTTDRP